jgi:hypothetical protein
MVKGRKILLSEMTVDNARFYYNLKGFYMASWIPKTFLDFIMSCDFDANLCYTVVSFFDFVTNIWFWFLKILRNQRISGSRLSEKF